jgi:hypothetical protein
MARCEHLGMHMTIILLKKVIVSMLHESTHTNKEKRDRPVLTGLMSRDKNHSPLNNTDVMKNAD